MRYKANFTTTSVGDYYIFTLGHFDGCPMVLIGNRTTAPATEPTRILYFYNEEIYAWRRENKLLLAVDKGKLGALQIWMHIMCQLFKGADPLRNLNVMVKNMDKDCQTAVRWLKGLFYPLKETIRTGKEPISKDSLQYLLKTCQPSRNLRLEVKSEDGIHLDIPFTSNKVHVDNGPWVTVKAILDSKSKILSVRKSSLTCKDVNALFHHFCSRQVEWKFLRLQLAYIDNDAIFENLNVEDNVEELIYMGKPADFILRQDDGTIGLIYFDGQFVTLSALGFKCKNDPVGGTL
uniref:Uncharacterized protein n=1 Tax=Caenorhabditis japonica TaxID=281687 RepID=A0A8R1IX74_CAEJA